MTWQLREYTVKPGEMSEWISEWRCRIVPPDLTLRQVDRELDRDGRLDDGDRHLRRRDPVVRHADLDRPRELRRASSDPELDGRRHVLGDAVDGELAGHGDGHGLA